MSDAGTDILDRLASAEDFSTAAALLAEWARALTGCEAVMLRFRESDDEQGEWLPALFSAGLRESFLRDETLIGVEECACGLVCGGGPPSRTPFVTDRGSFSVGDLQTTAGPVLGSVVRARGRCVMEGFESVAIFPLGGDGEEPTEEADTLCAPVETVGCLHLADRAPGKFTPHLATLEVVCRAAGRSLARFPEEQRKAALVSAIENTLAPTAVPEPALLDLAVCFSSATETAHLGGDFYEVVEFADGGVLLLVGDYCGRGIAAAGMAARIRQAIAGVVDSERSPAELLENAQVVLREIIPEDKFVTVAACRYTPEGRLEGAVAGHPPPLVVSDGVSADELPLPVNPPLGRLWDDGPFREGETSLEEGQTLVLYTDGVTEARRDGRFFGVEGIAAVWRGMGGAGLPELTKALCTASAEFHARGLPGDDRLVLTARPTRSGGRARGAGAQSDEPDR